MVNTRRKTSQSKTVMEPCSSQSVQPPVLNTQQKLVKNSTEQLYSNIVKQNSPIKTPTKQNTANSNLVNNIQTTLSELRNLRDGQGSADCRVCKQEVLQDSEAVSCDRCEQWLHLECSGLSKYEYDFYLKNPLPHTTPLKVQFICSVCKNDEDSTPELITKLTMQVEQISQQNKILHKGLAAVLEIVGGVSPNNNKMVVKTVEETVQTSIKEVLDDSKEHEEKKNNVIIFNLDEPTKIAGRTESQYQDDDLTKVNMIIRAAEGDEWTPVPNKNQVTRLGQRKDDSKRPRPVKVSFDSNEEKWHLVRNTRKVRTMPAFKDVSIQHDKTRKELNVLRALKTECTNKRNVTGKDFVIFAQQIMLRSDIPAFKEERNKTREADRAKGATTDGNY